MAARSTPSHPVRRVAAACLLAAATCLATVLAAPAPVAAWTEGACTDADGVTVVVDFDGFRDEVVVRCAPSAASGYEALEQVGLSYTPTARFPGFLCRIEGYPADDPCQNTPPPDAYWGYWRAEHGGSWTYSQYGPATTSPPPGPVEGWRFSRGDDAPPRQAPPAGPAEQPEPEPEPEPDPAPEPEPSSEPEPAPTAPATSSPAPPPADTDAEPGADDALTTTPEAADTTEATDDGPSVRTTLPPRTEDPAPGRTATPRTTTPSPAATEPTDDDAAMDVAAAPRHGGGPPMGTVVGVALVAVIGGAAVLVDRRRRQP